MYQLFYLEIFRQINAVYFLILKTRQIVVGQTANENLAWKVGQTANENLVEYGTIVELLLRLSFRASKEASKEDPKEVNNKICRGWYYWDSWGPRNRIYQFN